MEGLQITLTGENSVDMFYRKDNDIAYSGIIEKSKLAKILNIPQDDIKEVDYMRFTPRNLNEIYPKGAKTIIRGLKAWNSTSGGDFKLDGIYEVSTGNLTNNTYLPKLLNYMRENAKKIKGK